MPKYRSLEETYTSCVAGGEIMAVAEINFQKISDMIKNAEITISAANIIIKALNKSSREWMNVYINYYDAIRIYCEALLLTEKVKISNHKCLFAAICTKFKNLELDWGFFEKIRTKRNGANYYGEQICHEDFKAVEMQFKLYLSSLKKELLMRMP